MLIFIGYIIGFAVVAGVLVVFVDYVRRKHSKWSNVLAFLLAVIAGLCAGFALYLWGLAYAVHGEFSNFALPICNWFLIAFTLHMIAYTASSSTRILALPYLFNSLLLIGAVVTRGISFFFMLPILAFSALMFVGTQKQKGIRDSSNMMAEADVARNLYETFVQERSGEGFPEESSSLTRELRPKFYERVDLYREALLLLALIAESKSRNEFEQVLQSYEGCIFGSTPTDAGLQKLDVIKAAMADFTRLQTPAGCPREFTWAMEWFRAIGHSETNPVRLALFSATWMDEYSALVKTVKQLQLTKGV